MKKFSIQYNAVLDIDLFYTIYDWMRFHQTVLERDFNVRTMYDFDTLTLNDWKNLADIALAWLENEQLRNVYRITGESDAPASWSTLYYQTLAYMGHAHPWELTYRARSYDDQLNMCKECIEYLKTKRNEIREPNDNDI